MASGPVFTITYWGITGTLTASLTPPEVTDKIHRAIRQLAEQGRLADLRPGPELEETIRRRIAELPFHVRSTYGGNTTCVEVQTPDELLILDCGSGMRELGAALTRRWNAPGYAGSRAAHMLITHPHMDHTYAMPFVGPYYDPRNQFTLWGSRPVLDSLSAVLSPDSPLSHTYFPPTFDLMKALRDFREVRAGTAWSIGSTQVSTYALRHPGGCLAYRLENAGKVYVFATDHEHEQVPDPGLVEFARGADVLYTEGQYLEAEYVGKQPVPGDTAAYPHRGWGHSAVEHCVASAVAAGVRALHLGHREPRRPDEQIWQVERYAQEVLREELRRAGRKEDECRVVIPYEGMTLQF